MIAIIDACYRTRERNGFNGDVYASIYIGLYAYLNVANVNVAWKAIPVYIKDWVFVECYCIVLWESIETCITYVVFNVKQNLEIKYD